MNDEPTPITDHFGGAAAMLVTKRLGPPEPEEPRDLLAVMEFSGNGFTFELREADSVHKEYSDISRLKLKLPNSADIRKDGEISPKSIRDIKKQMRVIAGIINSQRNNGHNVFLRAVGTAALRDASNAAAIQDEIQNVIGDHIKFEIIDGLTEAALCAYGITNFYPHASGVVVDMGGGSTEFAVMKDGNIQNTASLGIGTASVLDAKRDTSVKAKDHIGEQLGELAEDFTNIETLYLSGGTFRNINKTICEAKGWDIKGEKPPEISISDYQDFIEGLISMKEEEWRDMPDNLTSRRINLPAALSLVKQLKKRFPEDVQIALTKIKTRDGLFRVMRDIMDAPGKNLLASIDFACKALVQDQPDLS